MPYSMIDREAPTRRNVPPPSTPPPQPSPLHQATVQALKQTPPGYMLTDVQPVEAPGIPGRGGREQPGIVVGYQATYTPRPETTPKSIGEQIAEFDPLKVGAGIAEMATGRKLTPNQTQVVKKAGQYVSSPALGSPTQFIGGTVASIEAPVYGIAGLAGVKGLPRPPTVTGALISSGIQSAISGKLVKSEEWRQLEQKPAGYAAGTLAGDIATSLLLGKATEKIVKAVVPRTVQAKVSSTAYHTTQAIKQSKVGVATAKASHWLKHTPPIETARDISRSVSTWLAKRGPKGAIEAQLTWDIVEKPVVTGFKKAFPTDIVLTAGTYKTYPGFELWATVKEAPKYAGYPTLRPLAAATYASLRRSMEQWVFEGSQFLPQQIPDVAKELASWETFSGTAESHRYAGYPVTHGPVKGVKLTSEPKAYDQILRAIERGMFPRMGGLSTTQVPVFAKPAYNAKEPLKYAADYGKQKASSEIKQLLRPVESRRTSSLTFAAPFFSAAIPKPAKTWEMEKQVYRPLDYASPRSSTRQAPIPVIAELQKQQQRQVPIQVPEMPVPSPPKSVLQYPVEPKVTIPAPPKTPMPPPWTESNLFWFSGGKRSSDPLGLFGRYRRKYPIKTAKQVLEEIAA